MPTKKFFMPHYPREIQPSPISSPCQVYPSPAGRTDPSTWQTQKFATAIYPTMALLNHSCDHNVAKYFVGSRMFVVAGRNIREGEEVCENYYPPYHYMDTRTRRGWLRYEPQDLLNHPAWTYVHLSWFATGKQTTLRPAVHLKNQPMQTQQKKIQPIKPQEIFRWTPGLRSHPLCSIRMRFNNTFRVCHSLLLSLLPTGSITASSAAARPARATTRPWRAA